MLLSSFKFILCDHVIALSLSLTHLHTHTHLHPLSLTHTHTCTPPHTLCPSLLYTFTQISSRHTTSHFHTNFTLSLSLPLILPSKTVFHPKVHTPIYFNLPYKHTPSLSFTKTHLPHFYCFDSLSLSLAPIG